LPAGKIDLGETEEQAVVREVFEETGFSIDPSKLEFVKKITWDFEEKIVEFTAYRTKLESYIEVNVNKNEHQGFAWVTAKECYARTDLMHGVHDLLRKIGYITKV
jgi:8-oxo-dGTP pyrophosphatase MutT (NUDIX family)